MRRFEFSATHRDVIDRPPAEVLGLFTELPEVLALFPFAAPAREIEPLVRYGLELGPFGIGSFSGTVRAEVQATRPSPRVLLIESIPGTGNTDLRARVELEPAARADAAEATLFQLEIWASPRRDVPAFLPLSLVQSVARRTVERSLAEGVRVVKTRLEGAGTLAGAPAAI